VENRRRKGKAAGAALTHPKAPGFLGLPRQTNRHPAGKERTEKKGILTVFQGKEKNPLLS